MVEFCITGAGVHTSRDAAWQAWTSRKVSGVTRNHPTFATKRATLIFPPPWIRCRGELSNVSRTVCAETCVRQILRDYRSHGWGPTLKYVRPQEIWRTFELRIPVWVSECNYQRAIDRKAGSMMSWRQPGLFTRKNATWLTFRRVNYVRQKITIISEIRARIVLTSPRVIYRGSNG